MRIFIAVNLPDEVKKSLAQWIEGFYQYALPFKWLSPDLWHITLVFLGEINNHQLTQTVDLATRVASPYSGFQLFTGNLMAFPDYHDPSVVSLRIKHSQLLEKLVLDLRYHFNRVKIGQSEKRKFKPHITLARYTGRVGDISLWRKEKLASQFSVNQISIMESILQPTGPCYRLIKNICLTK